MDAVEEIKKRLNIEDVVGQYVQLKRAGRNFKGISPFSNERTPSFDKLDPAATGGAIRSRCAGGLSGALVAGHAARPVSHRATAT